MLKHYELYVHARIGSSILFEKTGNVAREFSLVWLFKYFPWRSGPSGA